MKRPWKSSASPYRNLTACPSEPMERSHRPVMLEEALTGLALRADGRYLDCTFGRGGHARAILGRLGPEGCLLALDRDWDALQSSDAQELRDDPRLILRHGRFSELDLAVDALGWREQLAGVLMDLGVSSPQLDDPERGFSFSSDGPLDMRMDRRSGIAAAQWLAEVKETELADCLWRYGEERFARRIARAVVEYRRKQPILTTRQLAEIVAQALPFREAGKHPATRTFQAIRMWINDEPGELKRGLQLAVEVLAPGGRLVVISFHSLEDRVVKQFMRGLSRAEAAQPGEPPPVAPRLLRIGRAVKPGKAEVEANARARSAVLRVAEKLGSG